MTLYSTLNNVHEEELVKIQSGELTGGARAMAMHFWNSMKNSIKKFL